ncbi:tRNA N(3)-methylcytidine methyltransferase METTL2 isoform X3 [Chiloscyllium plagiosum]|uniref:tRNA N(3)-methylcytidine methyltransferase METTL2 isoform X3 n=1 Tax=Chiloscyllium plagiosum TaxID=36176 RepID=UPI001CB84C9D|nr:tRNA N(3)-methylcytidine methyltransferase METTL2 isoform X3 [Chiloscyllium plagiosum]
MRIAFFSIMPGIMWSGLKNKRLQPGKKLRKTVPSWFLQRNKRSTRTRLTVTGMIFTKFTRTDSSKIVTGFSQSSLSCFPIIGTEETEQNNFKVEVDNVQDSQKTDRLVDLSSGNMLGETGLPDTNQAGASATLRILEVGCGVGNTVFPILQTNNDPGLFVYCCDFSSTAVELVKLNSCYDHSRCLVFVHDLCDMQATYPMPNESLDIIILIFVLSAIHPDKMQAVVKRLSQLLKPGGMILFRDYGRYDMAQLRFKKGRCLSENFYVRGDGTRVYFFTQDELDELFTSANLKKVQNVVDRRLQVNRGKQLTMYRVWIQCKYRKSLEKGE